MPGLGDGCEATWSCAVADELPPIVASRTAASHSLELASALQAASRLIHGYAIDATIDRSHELREGRPVVWILGRRVADQRH